MKMTKGAAILEALKDRDSHIQIHRDQFRGVFADLLAAGIRVDTLDDLKLNLGVWRDSIPVLRKWLVLTNEAEPKEILVRLLSVPFAKGVEQTMVREFCDAQNDSLKWAIGNALEVLASDEIAQDLIAIALDSSHGKAREMVVLSLGKIDKPQAEMAAIECLKDDDVLLHAIGALAKIGSVVALPQLEALLKHRKAIVRKRARTAITRISNRSA